MYTTNKNNFENNFEKQSYIERKHMYRGRVLYKVKLSMYIMFLTLMSKGGNVTSTKNHITY